MSVRRRIVLLFGIIVALFGVALFALWTLNRQQFDSLESARLVQREEALDRFLQQWSASLQAFVNQESRSDALIAAIQNGDRKWVEENLGASIATDYRVHALWIYRPDGTRFVGRNSLYVDQLQEVPIPRDKFGELFSGKKTVQFYANSPAGVVEVRGATVHPSGDTERTSPPAGYLFAGRLLTPEELNEMSSFYGDSLSLVDLSYSTKGLVLPDGSFAFTRPLPGWNGEPAGRLLIKSESPLLEQVAVLRRQTWIWIIAFTLVLLGGMLLALRKWVWQPMRRLAQSLRGEDVSMIRAYDDDRGEIGAIARVIRSFFEQRETILREMSARRQAERELNDTQDQLRHSQKIEAVGRLAGGVAHDFNNYLTAIIGYGLLLQERFATRDTAARDELEEILKASYRAATLTRQLLAFSQKQTLYPRTINLNDLVRSMEPTLRRIAGNQIELRLSTEAPQGSVRVDRAQMEQVLINLVANAHDAMPQGGILTVSTADTLIPEPIQQNGIELPAGTYVTLEVNDTGAGMDEATRERIFEPFFTTKPAGEATGLSLAAVYGTVQQSEGAIAIKSAPGKGSSFLVHLPLVPDAAVPARSERYLPADTEQFPQGETVMVVENDTGIRRLISSVLKKRGLTVLTAEDMETARRYESENQGKIRLLLTNVVLRGGTGPELAEEFRLRQPEMEVLFIGGYPESHEAEGGAPGEDDLILAKPFTPGVLIERVGQILSRQNVA